MNKLNKTITIDAPVHAVFEYISKPLNVSKACPNLIAVEDMEPHINGVQSFHWHYKLANVHFFGTSDTTECDINHCLVNTIQGGITGKMTWLFQAQNEATQVTLLIEYGLPYLFVKKHGARVIAHENDVAVNSLLERLKANIENAFNLKLSGKS